MNMKTLADGLGRWARPLVLVASLASMGSAALAGPTFSKLVVFGDSLSDTGNTRASIAGGNLPIVAIPAGYGANGRFSNGPVWHETLTQALGLPLATNSRTGGNSGANNYNYAYGGARVDSATGASAGLLTQYNDYRIRVSGNSDPNALFAVWAGGNDMRDLVSSSNALPGITSRLSSLEGLLTNLVTSGANSFLIPNLPDLGKIPENRGTAREANATAVSVAWNSALYNMVLGLSDVADFYFLDVFTEFNNILANPAASGFVNTTGQCRSTGGTILFPTEISCANADTWVFWDNIHPTRAAHAVLGRAAADVIRNGSPLRELSAPATLALSLTAIGLMATLRRRREPVACAAA